MNKNDIKPKIGFIAQTHFSGNFFCTKWITSVISSFFSVSFWSFCCKAYLLNSGNLSSINFPEWVLILEISNWKLFKTKTLEYEWIE